MSYIPLDYWMICQRCGAKYRKSEIREEWTGLWVCTRGCFETQHPQDFVEGVEDDQSVTVSSPDVANAMGSTTLNGAVSQWSKSATLTSASGLAEDDAIGITMDNGIVHWSFIDEISGANITLGDGLPFAAASGNAVLLPSLNNETWT